MTALIVLLAAYGLFTLWLFRKSEQSIENAQAKIARLERQRRADAKLIAQLRKDVKHERTGLSDLMTRLKRISADHERVKDQGEKAAVAAMNILAKERDEFLESLQAWILIANAALLLGAKPTAELPKTPKPPLALPSYGFLVEPDLLLPADDVDAGTAYWAAVESAEPLPAGTNGTGGR